MNYVSRTLNIKFAVLKLQFFTSCLRGRVYMHCGAIFCCMGFAQSKPCKPSEASSGSNRWRRNMGCYTRIVTPSFAAWACELCI